MAKKMVIDDELQRMFDEVHEMEKWFAGEKEKLKKKELADARRTNNRDIPKSVDGGE